MGCVTAFQHACYHAQKMVAPSRIVCYDCMDVNSVCSVQGFGFLQYVAEDLSILGCYTMSSGEEFLIF